ncbi:MAG: amino acid permease, partial [Elusimicrobiota bacterium]|nr:amino acid permease [Elusimicrobiota bacterium]
MKLQKQIGLAGVFCIAAGAMISSGLFVLPAIAFAKAGPAVVLSYMIAGFLVIPTLFATAELLTAMPKAGGDYFYISRSMGAANGFLGGMANWFSLSCKSAFALVGIGAFITIVYPNATEMQMDIISALFCIIFTVINLKGVELAAKYQIWLVSFLVTACVIYILWGATEVRLDHYRGFLDSGFPAIFSTAGLVFVSFGGLTKVASIAEEVKDPTRNIPLGMFLAWVVVMALYVAAILVTVGVLEAGVLSKTLTPLSAGAGVFAGKTGVVILAFGAMLAFVSTANAGIMTASRAPLAMSSDRLLPQFFSKLNKRGVPVWPILFTSAAMIIMIFAFDIEKLVKVASAIMIVLFMFANMSLIFMRESQLVNYRPVFRAPFYPYVPVAGIVLYAALLVMMGKFAVVSALLFFAAAFLWYIIFPYRT